MMTAGQHTSTAGNAEPATPEPAHRSTLVLASSGPDSDAVERVTALHAQLSGSAAAHTTQLLDAAAGGDEERIRQARAALLDWSHGTLGVLLDAEEVVFDLAIRLIDADLSDRLRSERASVAAAVRRLAELTGSVEAAGAAVELRLRLSQYLRSFDDRALPVLARTSGLPLSSLWTEIEGLMADDGDTASDCRPTHCACGIVDEPEYVELDVRNVPHAIRHATVFGALDAIGPGEALILVAPHDPLPLLAQIQQRTPGRFTVSYLDRGPEAWRLQLTATAMA